jgi:hypothetical protein
MSLKAFYLRTICVLAVLAFVGVGTAQAAARQGYSLTGNARAQIGSGLPIPITFAAPPNGKVKVTPNAIIQQTTGTDPKQITQVPSQMQLTHPGTNQTAFVFFANSAVFQVRTMLTIAGPAYTHTAKAYNRTGPAVVTWCPGRPLPTAAYNPGCVNPLNPAYPTTGRLIYKRTSKQFGGLGSTNLGGSADVAIRTSNAPLPPCTLDPNLPLSGTNHCTVIFALATPSSMAVVGQGFGGYGSTVGMANTMGAYYASVNAAGTIQKLGLWVGPGAPNPAVSYGGPGTTGQVIVSARQTNDGGTEKFTITGKDTRVSGVGALNLVQAGVSTRFLTGPNANRTYINYTVPEPAAAAGAVAALAMLFGCHAVVRRRR